MDVQAMTTYVALNQGGRAASASREVETMTEPRLTDAELDELHRHGGSKRGNELTDRAIAELRELRAENAKLREENQWKDDLSENVDHLSHQLSLALQQNAKLVAALEEIEANTCCDETAALATLALASVKGEQGTDVSLTGDVLQSELERFGL